MIVILQNIFMETKVSHSEPLLRWIAVAELERDVVVVQQLFSIKNI